MCQSELGLPFCKKYRPFTHLDRPVLYHVIIESRLRKQRQDVLLRSHRLSPFFVGNGTVTDGSTWHGKKSGTRSYRDQSE